MSEKRMKIKIGREDVESMSLYIENMIEQYGNDAASQEVIQMWIAEWIKKKVNNEADAVIWHFSSQNK